MAAAAASARTPLIRFLDPASGSDRAEDMPASAREHMMHSWNHDEVACLVSDMSGFTKLTRKHGIIHFASIIARFRQITLPIMRRFGALLITTEADSFNCVFPSAATALHAANEMHRHIGEANRLLPPERAHFTLTLDGIGVDLGMGPILDKAGKLHGRTFQNAHILGEELCSKGSVALSCKAQSAVKDLPEFAEATWKPFEVSAEHNENEEVVAALEAMGSVFEMSLPNTEEIVLPSVDTQGYLQPALMPFAMRHDLSLTDADRDALDAQIRAKYMSQKAVLMFDFHYEGAATPEMQLGLKYELLARFERTFATYGGEALEDILYIFDDPVNALLAALCCRQIATKLESMGTPRTPPVNGPSISVDGFGIHIGDILIVPGTDIHWGDPVNTASKLGQDIGEDGQIIISQKTYEKIHDDVRLAPYEFIGRQVMLSGVQFNPYEVWDKEIEAEEKKDIIIKEFQRCQAPPNLMLEKATLAKVIMQLSPRFTSEEIDNMFAGIAQPESSTISLEAFLERGCIKHPPGSRLASRPGTRPGTRG